MTDSDIQQAPAAVSDGHPAVSADTHVFILAAGRGSRLGALSDNTSKWLLEVGDRPIADRQLAAYALARDEGAPLSLTVVTGHASGEVERYLDGAAPDAATLHNPEFDTLNNWYTVLLALRTLGDDSHARGVIVNSDLCSRPEWMAAFLREAATTDAEALIAVDLERQLTDESMKVATDETRRELREIGKVGIEDPQGEYVGMLMVRGEALIAFRDRLESFVGDPAAANEWYEGAVGLTAGEGTRWTIWGTPDSGWVEIDDEADLEAAVELESVR